MAGRRAVAGVRRAAPSQRSAARGGPAPERVTEHERVEEREDAREEAACEAAYEDGYEAADGTGEGARTVPPSYQGDPSVAPGWKAGGHAAWNVTGPGSTDCPACGRGMRPLLTVDSSEWRSDSESWRSLPAGGGAGANRPTGVAVGNFGKLNVFACPQDPAHPHRFSVQ